MGMAASQARYLSLTARKTNTEYQGQQVNQERTALANQSAGLFNQMLALDVPTPPAQTDYTKTEYVFTDPATSGSLTIDSIYVDDTKSDASKTIADVHVTEKKSVDVSNILLLNNNVTDPNQTGDSVAITKEDGKYYISLNGGTPYSLTGPTQMKSKFEKFQEAYNEYVQDGDTVKPAVPDIEDYYFKFTNSQTGIQYFIKAGGQDSTPDEITSGNIFAYTLEGTTKTETKVYEGAQLIKADDGTGRYESMIYTDANGKSRTYPLTLQTVQDEDAYNKAMDTYTAEKAIYEKAVADIDAKTTIIQQQDKTLELHLDQLDTEQQAIQTEMDAVKKVIDKNIEETFKTFA